MSTVISPKWQVTIPTAIRSLFNWQTGDTLDFLLVEGRVELVTRKTPVTALKKIIVRPRRSVSIEQMDLAIRCGGGNDRS